MMVPRPCIHLGCLFGLVGALSLAACSTSSSGATDSGAPSGGNDAAVIPMSCGSTVDCQAYGLDADTCVYRADAGDCAQIRPVPEPDPALRHVQVHAAKGGVPVQRRDADDPPCWQGWSPVAVLSEGPCPADAGTNGS